jgi:hypothetical protein
MRIGGPQHSFHMTRTRISAGGLLALAENSGRVNSAVSLALIRESLRILIASAILPELTHRIDNYAWILRPANVIAPAA